MVVWQLRIHCCVAEHCSANRSIGKSTALRALLPTHLLGFWHCVWWEYLLSVWWQRECHRSKEEPIEPPQVRSGAAASRIPSHSIPSQPLWGLGSGWQSCATISTVCLYSQARSSHQSNTPPLCSFIFEGRLPHWTTHWPCFSPGGRPEKGYFQSLKVLHALK